MLAEHAGYGNEVAEVTEAAMRGDLDFEESLRSRVKLLEGVDASALDEVYDAIVLAPGRPHAGPGAAAPRLPVRARLGRLQPDHRPAGRRPRHPLLPRQRARGRRRQAHRPTSSATSSTGRARPRRCASSPPSSALTEAATIAIGDGANDLDMLNAAGLGIAYNAKPLVRDAADTAVNVPYLDAIMYLLGICREEIEAADLEAGMVTPAPPLGVDGCGRRSARPTWNGRPPTAPRLGAGPPTPVVREDRPPRRGREAQRQLVMPASSSPSPSSSIAASEAIVGLWPDHASRS